MIDYRITDEPYDIQLRRIPEELTEICRRLNQAQKDLDRAEAELEEFSYSESSDITVNPNKHGFLLGDKPERFRILARVKSHPRYRELNNSVIYHRDQVRFETNNKEIVKLKFEVLKCLQN